MNVLIMRNILVALIMCKNNLEVKGNHNIN